MVFMGGVASPWADTSRGDRPGSAFRGALALQGRAKYHVYVQSKDLFAGITITGCCYKSETRPTPSFNPDCSTAIPCLSFFTMLMVILHLA